MKYFYIDYRKNYEERILKVQTALGCIESALCRTIFQSIDKFGGVLHLNMKQYDDD